MSRMRCFAPVCVLCVAFALLAGCKLGSDSGNGLDNRAGFVELEPVDFTVQDQNASLDLTSSRARMWWVFQAADEAPEDKPLAVFFNGGPGASSMDNFTMNTAYYTLHNDVTGDAAYVKNPHSWTSIANLLYIDARNVGFSYLLDAGAQNPAVRQAAFDAQNFNPYLDAADFIRVLLRLLAGELEELQTTPVMIVGESYGGVRATAMLHMLLNSPMYGAGGNAYYLDPALAEEIQDHYARVFPGAARPVTRAQAAAQFSRQVLIEPLLCGENQSTVAGEMWETPGSAVYQVAADTGTAYQTCDESNQANCDPYYNALTFVRDTANRSIYEYTKYNGWLFDQFGNATIKLTWADVLQDVTFTPAEDLPYMFSGFRGEAFRAADAPTQTDADAVFALLRELQRKTGKTLTPPFYAGGGRSIEKGDLPETFGELQPWDGYFQDLSYDILSAFYDNQALDAGIEAVHPQSNEFGEMFLDNLLDVETFITRAARDLVIYADALPEALDRLELAGMTWEPGEPADAARPGRIVAAYGADAGGAVRSIRFPFYDHSPHSVTVVQPGDLLADVKAWMQ